MMMKVIVRWDILPCSLSFWESLELFTTQYEVSYGWFFFCLFVLQIPFMKLRKFPSILSLLGIFIIISSWVLSNAFLPLLIQSCNFPSSYYMIDFNF